MKGVGGLNFAQRLVAAPMDMVSATGEPIYVGLLSGRTLQISADVENPTRVPSDFVSEALQRGALPAAQAAAMTEEQRAALAAQTRSDRPQLIAKAIESMVDAVEVDPTLKDKLFTKDGRPDANQISQRVGFQVQATERNDIWDAMNDDGAGSDSTDPD